MEEEIDEQKLQRNYRLERFMLCAPPNLIDTASLDVVGEAYFGSKPPDDAPVLELVRWRLRAHARFVRDFAEGMLRELEASENGR